MQYHALNHVPQAHGASGFAIEGETPTYGVDSLFSCKFPAKIEKSSISFA
jgi:hypothetical protein